MNSPILSAFLIVIALVLVWGAPTLNLTSCEIEGGFISEAPIFVMDTSTETGGEASQPITTALVLLASRGDDPTTSVILGGAEAAATSFMRFWLGVMYLQVIFWIVFALHYLCQRWRLVRRVKY